MTPCGCAPRAGWVALLASLALFPTAGLAEDPRPARIVTVKAVSDSPAASYPGVLRAADQAELTFQVSGRLVEFPVLEGQAVETGALIARLEEPRYAARLASAQAQYEKAMADLRRFEQLSGSGAISRRELDAQRTEVDVAEAALKAAREDVAATRMIAPFAGVIARRHVVPFQNIQANEPVVTLQDLSAMDVLTHIPTRAVLTSSGERDAVVMVEGLPGRPFPAEVRSISTEPDPVTQTYAVLLRMETPDDQLLLPGMAATVHPVEPGASAPSPVPLVPLAAVSAGADRRSFVWTVDPETGAVQRQEVTLGRLVGDSVRVTSGLSPGDRVVAAGLSQLREGMRVRPLED